MSVPGFYGKLASCGDFVTRDLAPGFTQPWDAWLAAGMQASRRQLGEDWLSAYLVCPLWRFALAAGVCGPNAVAGILMPSIDRVGRYFPLTVAQILEPGQSVAGLVNGAEAWFDRVETLMVSTLDQGVGFGVFEVALSRLGTVPVLPDNPVSHVACERASVWWGNDAEGASRESIRCTGLPDPQRFGCYLLGRRAEV